MTIDPEKYYTLRQLKTLNLFPWLKSYYSYRKVILRDMQNETHLLNTVVSGEKTSTRYYVKGSAIIELQKQIKQGMVL